ncbi:bacitracin ABC transporter ATP-binding protein [Clostridia bacterium]|nr:bacitracin ABC transporter ATP-binding protein [Clostridia bacterium]
MNEIKNNTVFEARGLTKRYGKLNALDGVNLTIRKGDIYGFVGENGAGKTTLIRILAGTAGISGGSISLFGADNPAEITASRRRMSGIIENPAVYPDLSATENLEIVRLQMGIPGRACIGKSLETVGLTGTGKKKAKNFSLGMKERLGLAMALISEPEFLVLDEPTNGLDPVGIVELRELIKKLNTENGITILISSHILGELYQLATCYGFIHQGKMAEQLSLEQLDEKCKRHLYLAVNDAPKAVTVIETKLGSNNYEVLPNGVIKLYDFLDDSKKVSNAMFEGGIAVSEITVKGDDLEQYYMNLIGGRKV